MPPPPPPPPKQQQLQFVCLFVLLHIPPPPTYAANHLRSSALNKNPFLHTPSPMSSPDDAGVATSEQAPQGPAKTLPNIDLPPPNPKDRRNSASRLNLKALPEESAPSPDGGSSPQRDRSPSARGRPPGDEDALEAHRKVPWRARISATRCFFLLFQFTCYLYVCSHRILPILILHFLNPKPPFHPPSFHKHHHPATNF